ncbi:MAG: hypothetical protein J3Q66DRAFT_441051 [Benniella sp.]|nr:MAG: hypothetical protein J3Q66DRAFT_441051 [Benniella sp.]
MSKRPSTTGEDEEPQKRAVTVEADEDAHHFKRHLACELFRGRPTRTEDCALQYITAMRLAPAPVPDEFMSHISKTHPQVTRSRIGWMWNRFKTFFSEREASDYIAIETVACVPEFITAFKAAPHLEEEEPTDDATDNKGMPPTSTPSDTTSRSSARTRSSRQSSASSGSGSLGPAALERMRNEFDQNFSAFMGKPWTLSSGVSVDDLLAPYIHTLTKESTLHSFVIADVSGLLQLVSKDSDKEELRAVLVQREGERQPDLSSIEQSYLGRFDKKPDEVEELLGNGWNNVTPSPEVPDLPGFQFRKDVHFVLQYIYSAYEQTAFTLPTTQLESWFLRKLWGFLDHFLNSKGVMDYQPGEVYLKASAWRKNKDRTLESKQALGRKVDGVVLSCAVRLELCVLEAAPVDNGATGTKALTDTRKMSKCMKDMYDYIRSKSTTNIRDQLVVFGMRISASTITFYTLRQRQGRFYQLACDGCVSFPSMWVPSGRNTTSILTVVSLLLRFKVQMIEMADKIIGWTNGAVLTPDIAINNDTWTPTLTTPPSSPRLSPTT